MNLTRREVLKLGAMGALVAAVPTSDLKVIEPDALASQTANLAIVNNRHFKAGDRHRIVAPRSMWVTSYKATMPGVRIQRHDGQNMSMPGMIQKGGTFYIITTQDAPVKTISLELTLGEPEPFTETFNDA